VTVAGSQKGLMLPPGLGFNAVSDKALAAAQSSRLPKTYWDWTPVLESNAKGFFPYTPATNLLYGLKRAVEMLLEEGMPQVFARHQRHAEATRAAVRGWGLEVLCADEREHSGSLTAVLTPDGYDADAVREVALSRYDMSLGAGLGRLAGRVFRIGHLGHFNDLTLAGTLSGVQMSLRGAGVPVEAGGLERALERLEEQ
jgi:alanine-glyoxylate transaminase / serine-glyoxylate transaminase / serine-pyruvate transaminase